jgi:AAA domain
MQQTKPNSSVTVDDEQKWLALGLDVSAHQTAVLHKNLPKVILKPTLAAVRDKHRFSFDLDQPYSTVTPGYGLPIVCERACDVTSAPTEWLWPGRIPLGRFSVLAAQQRHVASRIACDLAARVSAGDGWPGEPRQEAKTNTGAEPARIGVAPLPGPGETCPSADAGRTGPEQIRNQSRVLFLASRGEIARSVVPGLTRAGADLARVLCVSGVLSVPTREEANCIRHVELPDNFHSLRGAVAALPGLRLVVIDPIEEFLDTSTGGRGYCPAAGAIGALEEIARGRNIAIVGIAGLCRGAARPGALPPLKHRILNSLAQVAWGIVRERGEPGRFVLAPLSSLMEGTATWLPLQLDGEALTWNPEPIPEPAEDVRPAAKTPGPGPQWAGPEEAAWLLREYLASGSRPAVEVQQMAESLGISRTMLYRVKEEMGVKSEKPGFRGKSHWSLPGAPSARTDTARIFGEQRGSLADSREIPKDPRVENLPV